MGRISEKPDEYEHLKGSIKMSKCQCEKDVIPDYTKVGFENQPANANLASENTNLTTENTNLTTENNITVEGLKSQLDSAGVQALNLQACVSASYDPTTNKICFSFPIIGQICFPSPISIPIGATLKVCGDLCTSWGIPTGLKITLYLNNNPVWSGVVWGSC